MSQSGSVLTLRTPVLRLMALASFCLFATVLGTGAASAHAELESANPAKGQVVSSSPAHVTLRFGEKIGDVGNGIVVTDATGKRFDQGTVVIKSTTASAKLKSLTTKGPYTVAYRIVSADGHVVSSSYSFTFQPGTQTSSPTSANDTAGQTAGSTTGPSRVVLLGVLIGALAGGVSGVFIARRRKPTSSP